MEKLDGQNYRDDLAKRILASPKKQRRRILNALSNDDGHPEFWSYWSARLERMKKNEKNEPSPDLEFSLDNFVDFEEKILTLAQAIYRKYRLKNRNYDPYQGDQLCGAITDEIIEYLSKKGITAERICRNYCIQNPEGHYDESFGHVFLIVRNGESSILVDATYLQWINKEKRVGLKPVLVLQFTDEQDYRAQLLSLPIIGEEIKGNKHARGFYLGFHDSDVKAEIEANPHAYILSNDQVRIDDPNQN